jgi:(1->4)-alpha-D-glucan 1-alpha-D-glucosylmutase
MREAKRATNWLDPDEAHEALVCDWALTQRDVVADIVERVTPLGEWLSLAATLLRMTTPGVPDVYQGDELWFLALVDPDNRRPVDWDERREALGGLRAGEPVTRATRKLDLIHRLLDLRRRHPEPFAAAYTPIDAGPDVCAFLRGDDVFVAAALRPGATSAWTPPPGRWRDVLSDAHTDDGRVCLERVR